MNYRPLGGDPPPSHVGLLKYESVADPSPPVDEQTAAIDETWRFRIGPVYVNWHGAIDEVAVRQFLAEVRELLDHSAR